MLSLIERLIAACAFTFMTLSGIGCGMMAIFSSPYEAKNMVAAVIIFSVTVGLVFLTVFAWTRVKRPDSKLWSS